MDGIHYLVIVRGSISICQSPSQISASLIQWSDEKISHRVTASTSTDVKDDDDEIGSDDDARREKILTLTRRR